MMMSPSMLDDAGDASSLGSIHHSISSNSDNGTVNGNAADTIDLHLDDNEYDISNHHLHHHSTSTTNTAPPLQPPAPAPGNNGANASNRDSNNSASSNHNPVRPQTPSTRAASENKAAQGQFSASRTPIVPGVLSPKRNGKGGGAKTTAKDVVELTDYQLGDCLGKGAFGSVYRALNWGTGETVAVKQVRLADLPSSELRVIMQEIDLLKNLDHANIVKYHGFVKSKETLNIILEYCENGSLHSISKNFGRFPENLVSLYMSQVLQGLLYLHEQGVVHRDIKGANILTTKQGLVKLADFGVASRTTGLHESSVVGTPYWMAPEVIELSGASTASDIWSLGCTVIELLDGKPPYAENHTPLQALFRIVNDDHPPLPKSASPAVTDFLMQCFQKDRNLRVTAKKLLKHPWIVNARRSDKIMESKFTEYEEAVKSVREWNEALQDPGPAIRPTRPNGGAQIPVNKQAAGSRPLPSAPRPPSLAFNPKDAERFMSPKINNDNWDDDFSSIHASALKLPHLQLQDNFGGMLSPEKLKEYVSSEDLLEHYAKYDETLKLSPTERKPRGSGNRPSPIILRSPSDEENTPPRNITLNMNQSRKFAIPSLENAPFISPSGGNSSRPRLPHSNTDHFRETVEDYSDVLGDDASIFSQKFEEKITANPLLSPDSKKTTFGFGDDDPFSEPNEDPSDDGEDPLENADWSQPTKKKLNINNPFRKSGININKFAENKTDEDFSDILAGNEVNFTRAEDNDRQVSSGSGLMLSSKLTSNSFVEEDDEDDPFAELEEGLDEMDLEANIARDKYARLRNQVEELVGSLKMSQEEEMLADISEQMVTLFCELPETKNIIISAHGMLPILEILEICRRREVSLNLLKIVNAIIFNDYEVQENLCFVGGIPVINQFASKKYPREIRLEAALFVQQMFQSSVFTLQMFVSAGGLNVLVEFLEEDYEDECDLVLIGVNGIWSVFDLQGSTPKNDFCRILSRNSVLDPLSLVLSRVLDEEGELAELCEGRIAHIFLIFSQAENYVKEMVAERTVLHRVLKELKRMSPTHQITMLKFIKNLSMLSSTLESLQNSNAIDVLTDLLRSTMRNQNFREVSNQVLSTIYNMCRLSKTRQEDAALNGIIPLLQKIVKTERPLKEFALPILCDMANSGKVGRRELWRNKGLNFYVSLLSDPYWQVTALDAIFAWLQEETAKVEEYLLDGHSIVPSFSDTIVRCVSSSKANAFENLLEPLQKLLRLSPAITSTLARPDMFTPIGQRLHHSKPAVRVNLLRILSTICDSSHEQGQLLSKYGLLDIIEELQNDTRVLVRELATLLVKSTTETEGNASSSKRRAAAAVPVRRPSINGSTTSASLIPPHATPIPASPRIGSGKRYIPTDRGESASRRPAPAISAPHTPHQQLPAHPAMSLGSVVEANRSSPTLMAPPTAPPPTAPPPLTTPNPPPPPTSTPQSSSKSRMGRSSGPSRPATPTTQPSRKRLLPRFLRPG